MRVNVSKVFISKTFMNGLKVSPQQQQQQQQQQQLEPKLQQQRQLSKSNNLTLEFYLNLITIFKQTLAAKIQTQQQQQLVPLKEFAIFAISIQQQQQQQQQQKLLILLIIIINIFISFNAFNRLTVLMNDLRLKTFYCQNTKINKSNKRSLNNLETTKKCSSLKSFNQKQLLSFLINFKLTSLSSTTTATTTSSSSSSSSSSALTFSPSKSAAAASAVAFATSATILLVNKQQQQQQQLQQTFQNNNRNHYRTYNNSKKSNKIFLYYTPRDPRLRILLKTKHFFSNRPQQQQQSPLINKNNNNCCCSQKSVKNLLLSDLCNYGELIGGLSGEYNKNIVCPNKTIVKNSNNFNLVCYLINSKLEICDKKSSDNLATAGAAIVTISAANILLVVLSEFAQELLKTIEILLSFHSNHQKLKIFNVKSKFGLHDSIL